MQMRHRWRRSIEQTLSVRGAHASAVPTPRVCSLRVRTRLQRVRRGLDLAARRARGRSDGRRGQCARAVGQQECPLHGDTMRDGGRQDTGVCVPRAVRIDRLDARCRDSECVLIAGIRGYRRGISEICAFRSRAYHDGSAQQAEHCARRFVGLTAPVADARIPSLLTNLLSLPMVHRHDDVVGGKIGRDTDHGGDVEEDAHALGQDA